jgi:hypothetical protein
MFRRVGIIREKTGICQRNFIQMLRDADLLANDHGAKPAIPPRSKQEVMSSVKAERRWIENNGIC